MTSVEQINSHKCIQLTTGRPSHLYIGDLVVLVCGARYAPDQYEGIASIDPTGADMLAGGGLIGKMRYSSQRITRPTRLAPIGLITDTNGETLNIGNYSLTPMERPGNITVIAAVGASMNAGKTTATASLAHGLVRAGYSVATLKATGTGAFGDYNAYKDAGADYVADFVDVGMGSTYLESLGRITKGMHTLLGHAANAGCNVAIIEIADGVYQKETAALLSDKRVQQVFDSIMFAAPCAASVLGGCSTLKSFGLEPTIVTGMVSRSPLAIREVESQADISISTKQALCDPATAGAMLATIRRENHKTTLPQNTVTRAAFA